MYGTTYRTCSVDCCTNKHDSNGYCGKHMSLFRRHRSPIGPFRKSRVAAICSVEDCSSRASNYGHCGKHYKWLQRTGDATVRPEVIRPIRVAYKARAKYKSIRVKDHPFYGTGVRQEHRVVMSEKIGRKLQDWENVHHINGDGMDNRPENLELWVVWQPPGQRLEDKIAWAKEILAVYEPEALRGE